MLSCTPAQAALRRSPWAEGSPQALQGCSSPPLPELLHWSPAGSASLYQQPASQDWLLQRPKRLTALPQLGTALMGHPSPQPPIGQQKPHRDPLPAPGSIAAFGPRRGISLELLHRDPEISQPQSLRPGHAHSHTRLSWE